MKTIKKVLLKILQYIVLMIGGYVIFVSCVWTGVEPLPISEIIEKVAIRVWLFVFTTASLFAIELENKINKLEHKLTEIKLQNQRLYSLFLQVTKEE